MRLKFRLAMLLVFLAGCSLEPREGQLNCVKDGDCPGDWVCVDGSCYSSTDQAPTADTDTDTDTDTDIDTDTDADTDADTDTDTDSGSESWPECVPDAGPCCDGQGYLTPGVICGTVNQYQCPTSDCKGDKNVRSGDQRCADQSTDCATDIADTDWGSWHSNGRCQSTEKCQDDSDPFTPVECVEDTSC